MLFHKRDAFRCTGLLHFKREHSQSLKHRAARGETGQRGIFLKRNIDPRFTRIFYISHVTHIQRKDIAINAAMSR
jgi:hypothetical protein